MSNKKVFILGGSRTPMCNLLGDASSLTAPDLGATAIKGALENAKVPKEKIEEVIMGCVLPHGLKQAPARQAALGAGLGYDVNCVTINKMCGSGMKAVMMAHDGIKAGSYSMAVAGGMESMSNAPHLILGARKGYRLGNQALYDSMFLDGLEDAYEGKLMGEYAQQTADKYSFSREMMDEYAIKSAQRAIASADLSQDEIVPLEIKERSGVRIVDKDEQPGKVKFEKIPQLKPAFTKDGTVTAANSSCISDGASALILGDESVIAGSDMKPLARIIAHSSHSRIPSEFTIAPAFAMKQLMDKNKLSKNDFDLFEVNEAFAVVSLFAIKELELDIEKVNIRGGACSQGHPVGSSGSRILLTLIRSLIQTGGKRGLAGICIGGGEATAMAIELV